MLKLTVSQDGSGDFASISEAVLAVPYELEAEICIGPGIYREKLVCEKRALTLRGRGSRCHHPDLWGTAVSCPTRMGGPPTPSAATPLFSAAAV